MRVLVIEDDVMIRSLVERVLSRAPDIDVETVGFAARGIDWLHEVPFDVVILDHELPETTGLEVLAEIRAMDRPIPVVYLTGQGDEQIAYRALSEGAVDYLVKDPDTFEALPTIVRRAHDAWAGLEALVAAELPDLPEADDRPVPGEDAQTVLGTFLARSEVEMVLVHDASGTVLLPATSTGEDGVATRSAALSHQAQRLAEAAGLDAKGHVGLIRGAEHVLAHTTAWDGIHVLVLFETDTTPWEALDGVRRAVHIVRDVLADEHRRSPGGS